MDQNNQQTNEYPLKKNSYVAFDAISLRNLILQRLNDQGLFTDQNYVGSNLASIIDIISFAFNTLIFYLHQTSNESTFTEAQLYENISKIVKLLDYKPIGYQTSTLSFQVTAANLEANFYTIPRYSYIQAEGIPFSFVEDVTFNINENNQIVPLTEISNRKLLYQGTFRENPQYIAAGDKNETLLLETNSTPIDHFNIDVYVYESRFERWFEYRNVSTIYTQDSSARVFEKRLNSNQNYEISFGDGINGKRLEANDIVRVYFLQSNGEAGIIGPQALKNSSKSLFSSTIFSEILSDVNEQQFNYMNNQTLQNLIFDNVAGSTTVKTIEGVDSIRTNAPSNFKSQYRLVTKEDYETFIKINFANFISDVKVFDNWDYTSNYLRYFKDIQVTPTAFKQILLNQLLYADSCNFNNIYICALPKVSQTSTLKYLLPAQKEIIVSNISDLKTLTTEITFLDPIYFALALGVRNNNNQFDVTDRDICRLQIIKKPLSKRSNSSILTDINTIFQTFFSVTNLRLGQPFNYSQLISQLLAVDGVQEYKTIRTDDNTVYDGVSFYGWNPNYSDLDKNVITFNKTLNPFQLYYFQDLSNVKSKFEIVENSLFV
jgi:hypothetical protein